MSTLPPCAGKWELFDSRDIADHEQAAKLCAACPIIDACRARLDAARDDTLRGYGPEGTWAGVLVGGAVVLDSKRLAVEADMFTAEEARIAHAAYVRGERTDRARIGERVYQRRRKSAARAAAKAQTEVAA